MHQYGFAVLEVLFGQRQPRVGHTEHDPLAFLVIEGLSEFEAFLGIQPVPL
jgi:hypothetical protein